MLNLIMSQLMAILKQNGFDGEKAQAQVSEAIADLKAMKESQDRCEAMLRRLSLVNGRVMTDNRMPLIESEPVQ